MYNCSTCDKRFKKLANLQKHRLLCELLAASQDSQVFARPGDEMPNPQAMWATFKLLLRKHESIQKEVKRLRQWVTRQHRKLNLVDWLNSNRKEAPDYHTWIQTIDPTQKDLALLFDRGYVQGIYSILQRYLALSEETQLPIRTFSHKKDTFFVSGRNRWELLDKACFNTLVLSIHKKLIRQFRQWEQMNPRIVSDLNSSTWERNLQEVNGGKLPFNLAGETNKS